MLETTTRGGTVVRTEVLRAPLTAVVTIEGPEVYWEKSYSDPEVSLIIDAADRGYLLSSEIEALIHRATVRLVNAAHPGAEDFRVTRENAHVWAEGTVKA